MPNIIDIKIPDEDLKKLDKDNIDKYIVVNKDKIVEQEKKEIKEDVKIKEADSNFSDEAFIPLPTFFMSSRASGIGPGDGGNSCGNVNTQQCSGSECGASMCGSTQCDMGTGPCDPTCEYTCQSMCQNNCQDTCENNCQIACLYQCQSACESSCEVEMESGPCNACQRACQNNCELGCQVSCLSACQTSCQETCQRSCQCSVQGGECGACQSACQTTCQSACQCSVQGCESCQSSCQLNCQNTCQLACQCNEQLNQRPRPKDYSWSMKMVNGRILITTDDINKITASINEFRYYKYLSTFTGFTPLVKNTYWNAKYYNQLIDAITPLKSYMTGSIPAKKKKGDIIKADDMRKIITLLNSIR